MNKFRYCKICGKTPLDCDFLKAKEVCNDADLYKRGYEKAFNDIINYIKKNNSRFVTTDYNYQHPYIDWEELKDELENKFLNE